MGGQGLPIGRGNVRSMSTQSAKSPTDMKAVFWLKDGQLGSLFGPQVFFEEIAIGLLTSPFLDNFRFADDMASDTGSDSRFRQHRRKHAGGNVPSLW